jgi:hypothetical protein
MERLVHQRLQRYVFKTSIVCHWMWLIPLIADIAGRPFASVTGQRLNFVILLFAVPGCLLTSALYVNERILREQGERSSIHTWDMVRVLYSQLESFRKEFSSMDEEWRMLLLRQAREFEERTRIASTDTVLKEVFDAARKRTQHQIRDEEIN